MSGGARRTGRVLWILPLALLAWGCSVLVDADADVVHCSQEEALGPPACPAGDICEQGLCVTAVVGTRTLGQICERDLDCGDGASCLDVTQFGGEGPKRCSWSCCSSSDCTDAGEGLVCWAPSAGGGSFCLPAKAVGLGAPGLLDAGKLCSSDDDCRSSRCLEGLCVDVCCLENDCVASAGTCRVRTNVVSPGASWACDTKAEGKAAFLDPCTVDGDCVSNLCVELGSKRFCSASCCKSDECPAFAREGQPGFLSCGDVLHGGSLVRACASWVPETAVLALGADCDADEECRSGRCAIPAGSEQGQCSDVCCEHASCGDLERFECLAHGEDGRYSLRCEPKP